MDRFTFAIILIFATSNLIAADQTSELLSVYTPAKVKKRYMPGYPRAELENGNEGIVTLSYVINQKGRVIDPVVENSSGRESFDRSALKAIKKWRFIPATKDGLPMQQCRTDQVITFVLADNDGVGKKFQASYGEIQAAIRDKQVDVAEQKLSALRQSSRWNLTEWAYMHLLQADFHASQNQAADQLRELKKAIRHKDVISMDTYLTTLRKIFILDLDFNYLAHANRTFRRIEDGDNDDHHSSTLRPYAKQVQAAIEGNKSLVVAAKLRKDAQWNYQLARRQFTLRDLSGSLDYLDIRCDNKRSTYPMEAGKTFHVPASWGECHVFVSGQEGASFNLVELAGGA